MNLFSERLKKLREENGLTQSQLAELLNTGEVKVLPQNISYWEKGRQPQFEILIKISHIFNVTTDYLIGKSDFKNSTQEMLFTNLQLDELLKQLEDKDRNRLMELIEVLLKNIVNLYSINPSYLNTCSDILFQLNFLISKYLVTLDKNFLFHLCSAEETQEPIDVFSLLNLFYSKLNFLDQARDSLTPSLNNLLSEFKESLIKRRYPDIFSSPLNLK